MFVSQDPDFAEVLTDLNSRELFWLSRGQLEISVVTEGRDPQRISGFIIGRKSCDSKCPPSHKQMEGMFFSCSRYSRRMWHRGGINWECVHLVGVVLTSICGCFCHLPLYSFSFFLSPSLGFLSPTANLAYRPAVGFGGAPTAVCRSVSVFVRNTETEMAKECDQQPTPALFFVKQTCSLSDVIFL